MNFRDYLNRIDERGGLAHMGKQVDPNIEIAAVINKLGEKPVLFEKVRGSD